MADDADTSHARLLGAEIRNRRLARGMSLRALAKQLGLSAHGTLLDYEHGRRIPPEDLILGCERIFQISDGALRNLREKALAERANQQTELLLAKPDSAPGPDPDPPVAAPHRRHRYRWVAAAAVVLVIGVGVGIGLRGHHSSPPASAATPTPAPASRTIVASWGICWGGQVAKVQPTDAVTYAGARTLQITVNKPNTAGDFATCTTHGLDTLRPGMTVSAYLKVPAAAANQGGLAFFVYDSQYHPTWAPETPQSQRQPLPENTDWHRYVWTVPAVDTVHTLGIEVYSATDQPLIVWLGAITW